MPHPEWSTMSDEQKMEFLPRMVRSDFRGRARIAGKHPDADGQGDAGRSNALGKIRAACVGVTRWF